MSWPNPFRRRTANTRNCWGYTFEWTDDHLSPAETEPLKHSYDTLAEECLTKLDDISPPGRRGTLPRRASNDEKQRKNDSSDAQSPPSKRDLYALLRDNADADPWLEEMWTEINTVPPWVDWAQIARGQDVFYRYGGANLTGLAYQSLLGGMGAARVVETLARTGGFSTKVARRRLFETTQHILECTASLESIQPGGDGFASSVRVRFLHAAVRNRITQLAKERPSYYNMEEWGIPINDLDSIATILSFSATLIWLSLPRQGIYMRAQEIEDYIALWRYIGYIMGTPDEWFATPTKAKAVAESLLYYEVNPSETSKLMANNIIKSLDDQPPGYASADFLIASARWLNGNKLGDRLGLPRPSLYYWALMAGQCVFFIIVCYLYRSIPSWDRKKVAGLRKVFWDIIVESKYGMQGEKTGFDFKYVPEYETVTELTESKGDRPRMRGVETRNLKWLGIGVGVLVGFGYVAYKVTSILLDLAWRVL